MNIYHGLGNTFVIIDYNQKYDKPEIATELCKNQYDGLILVKTKPLEMIIYNKDGTLAKMCGNGIRCFIKYCYDKKIITKNSNVVLTGSGEINTIILSTSPFCVKVEMKVTSKIKVKNIIINNNKYKVSMIDTGVKHAIIICDDLDKALIDAKDIYECAYFNKKVNIDFVKIIKNIYLKTYERGVGFTKACGTGALATFLVLKEANIICDDEVEILVDGGVIKAGVDKRGPYIIGPSELIE